MKLHHIGYAVSSVFEASENMNKLGFNVVPGSLFDDKRRNVQLLFVSNGLCLVELIAPLDHKKNSPVDVFLSKKMPGPYHFCYEVEDIEQAIYNLTKAGYSVIESVSTAEAFESNVAFLFNRSIGIVELLERKL